LGVESALYSILTYVAASKTLDFILHGIEEYHAVTIVSEASAAIRDMVTGRLDRTVTVIQGRGGASGAEQDILYCVVTRLEIGKIRTIVQELDRHAFIVIHPLSDVYGGRVKKPVLH
jgi:uncharacterized membrane-anchored protein YitT (DUF2179 family)